MIFNDETVTCVISVVEVDEVVDEGYEWLLNGVSLLEASNTLDLGLAGVLSPGDVLTCGASVTNGHLGGSDLAEAEITVDNRPPPAPIVTISPTNPQSDEDLLCEAMEPVDPDGEAILAMNFQWTDGNATISGQALSANYIAGGDEWTCEGMPKTFCLKVRLVL